MHVIIGVEIRAISVLRDPFLDARQTFSFASSAIYRACLPRPHPGRACPVACLLEGSCGRRKRSTIRMSNRLR